MKCIECGDQCGTKHFNIPFDPELSVTHENFKCNEKFNNYICIDCKQKCPFQIVKNGFKKVLLIIRVIQKEAVIKGISQRIMLSLEMKLKITILRKN